MDIVETEHGLVVLQPTAELVERIVWPNQLKVGDVITEMIDQSRTSPATGRPISITQFRVKRWVI